MSIQDIKHVGKFHVDFLRIVLDLPHEEISQYTIDFLEEESKDKDWIRTTYHSREANDRWMANLPHREKMEEDILKAAHEFVERTGRKEFNEKPFLFYWGSVYKEHDQHGSHNHPNSLIAGTYYPQSVAESESITFEAPWSSHTMHDTLPFKDSMWDYHPNTGDCMLWPSWVNHRVSPQKASDKLRVAISFNLDYGRYHT